MRLVISNILLLCTASACIAHLGDRLLPILEIPDSLVARIDIHDGTIEDWEAVIGEPTLTALEFGSFMGKSYDPNDLDFRVWLAWHDASNRVFIAVQGVDDVATFPTDLALDGATNIEFDGDHSGGVYGSPSGRMLSLWEKNQSFTSHPHSGQYEPHVDLGWVPTVNRKWCCWFSEPPLADAGGTVFGESPAVWVTEKFVTPFDLLAMDSRDETDFSVLVPGAVIGFRIMILDDDDQGQVLPNDLTDEWFAFPPDGRRGEQDIEGPDRWADGLLVAASQPVESVVKRDSWGRIKVSLEEY